MNKDKRAKRMKIRTVEDEPVWESPTEDDIQVQDPVTARARRYQIIAIVSGRIPQKFMRVTAQLYDSDDNPTGTVEAMAKGAALQSIMTDMAESGEDYQEHGERLATELLKAKGKMAPGAVKV